MQKPIISIFIYLSFHSLCKHPIFIMGFWHLFWLFLYLHLYLLSIFYNNICHGFLPAVITPHALHAFLVFMMVTPCPLVPRAALRLRWESS